MEVVTPLDRMDRARLEVSAERGRARRAAHLAARHEQLATAGPVQLRDLHQRAAAANRETERRHLAAEGIQASHLARLRASAWDATRQPSASDTPSPLFSDRLAIATDRDALEPSARRDRGDDADPAPDALAAELRTAIDRGQLRVEYQPIVSLSDRQMIGVEALVRWQHPRLGLLQPDQFLALAEEIGVITRLDQAVLAEATSEAARWLRATPDPPFVSVNITAGHLQDSGLVREIATLLGETGLPASHLHLEIVEGAVVRPYGPSLATLDDLVRLGVTVAIDDFGTGYSNLSYLRRLPVKTIKVDRSFVADICPPGGGPDPAGAEILVAIITLSHALGLTVTVEGVETAAQAEWLRSIGADSAQGWHFGRPVGMKAIRATIGAGRGTG
ncbi:EAL domain-containing protein [Asanoa iriomotensis]|uniref:EAL domain-containing protein n=1 Tax=Asanoa iriomotensis TaxID=234613 RepID=UPI0019458ADA|nr:EAL domain-containing protein [Asanoa iriomotensis]